MDVSLSFGGDLVISSSGDLLVSSGPQETLERVLRRLLTNSQTSTNPVGDYLWHQSYGAGLGSMIGSPANVQKITAIIRTQILKEASVAASPVPTVTVTTQAPGYVYATITYTDANTGQASVLNVPLS